MFIDTVTLDNPFFHSCFLLQYKFYLKLSPESLLRLRSSLLLLMLLLLLLLLLFFLLHDVAFDQSVKIFRPSQNYFSGEKMNFKPREITVDKKTKLPCPLVF